MLDRKQTLWHYGQPNHGNKEQLTQQKRSRTLQPSLHLYWGTLPAESSGLPLFHYITSFSSLNLRRTLQEPIVQAPHLLMSHNYVCIYCYPVVYNDMDTISTDLPKVAYHVQILQLSSELTDNQEHWREETEEPKPLGRSGAQCLTCWADVLERSRSGDVYCLPELLHQLPGVQSITQVYESRGSIENYTQKHTYTLISRLSKVTYMYIP